MFLSNDSLAGVGYDFNALLFSADASGFWCAWLKFPWQCWRSSLMKIVVDRSFLEFADKKKSAGGAAKADTGSFSSGTRHVGSGFQV